MKRWFIGMLVLVFAASAAGMAMPRADRSEPTIGARLSALSPDDPMGYFTLGEDLGYAHDATPATRRLARELLLIAAAIDRESDSQTGLDRSAALALADFAESEADRAWLRATAEALAIERRGPEAVPAWPVDTAAVGSDDLNLRVAETLARARANDGIRVQRELSRSPVERTLVRSGVPTDEARGIMAELNIVASTRQCPGCRNDRAVRVRAGDGRLLLERCPVCRGNPGAQLGEEAYLSHLRAEALVLGVRGGGWSTHLFLNDNQPLNDTGFAELLRRYRVDARARVWEAEPGRGPSGEPRGRWVRPVEDDEREVEDDLLGLPTR